MKNTIKIFSGVLAGCVLTLGGTKAFGAPSPTFEAQKNEIAKQYIYAQVRLNEVPTLDLTVLSIEEMTKAYGELASEKNAFTNENLFVSLHDDAVQKGVACR